MHQYPIEQSIVIPSIDSSEELRSDRKETLKFTSLKDSSPPLSSVRQVYMNTGDISSVVSESFDKRPMETVIPDFSSNKNRPVEKKPGTVNLLQSCQNRVVTGFNNVLS